jgi:hypothetical protein
MRNGTRYIGNTMISENCYAFQYAGSKGPVERNRQFQPLEPENQKFCITERNWEMG